MNLRNLLQRIIIFLFLVFPSMAAAQFAGGDGSGGNPYQISTCTELQSMKDFKSSNFILLNDIDCSDTINWNSGSGFLPVGNDFFTTPFTGTLNGNGYIIRDLYINRSSTTGVGLFGYAQGIIQKIGLENVNITGSDRVGTLAGDLSGVTVTNVFATGVVVGGSGGNTGGLFGRQDNGADSINSYAYVNVSASGSSQVGGFLGYKLGPSSGTTITNSFAAGPVSGNTQGGIGGSTQTSTSAVSYSGVYFDSSRSGQSACLGSGTSTGCSSVNSSNSNSNYFFNNSSNAPLSAWDFSTVWKICSEGFPVFINGDCSGALTSTNVQPASLLRNATGNVTVTFTTSRLLPANGKIIITFPSGFTLNSGGSTAVSSASGTDGSFAASTSGQTITLTRSGGTSTAKNTAITLVLSNISNPSTSGSTGTYSIALKDSLSVAFDRNDSVSADTITCPSGRYGTSCTDCPGGSGVDACTGHGTCSDGASGSGICTCASGFSSSNCSTCSTGYYSASCSQCPGSGNCSEHGTCDEGIAGTGVCTCNTGFTGTACTSCSTGYFGSSCSQCPGSGNCSEHGTCDEGISGTGSCSCSSGYSGTDCSSEVVQTPTLTISLPRKKSNPVTFTCSVAAGNAPIASYKFIIRGPVKKKNTKSTTVTKNTNSYSRTFSRGQKFEISCSYTTSASTQSQNSSKKDLKL